MYSLHQDYDGIGGGRNLYGFARNRVMDLFDFLGQKSATTKKKDQKNDKLKKEPTSLIYTNNMNMPTRTLGVTGVQAQYTYRYEETENKCCCHEEVTKWRISVFLLHASEYPQGMTDLSTYQRLFDLINQGKFKPDQFDEAENWKFADPEGVKIHEAQHVHQYEAQANGISHIFSAPTVQSDVKGSIECEIIKYSCSQKLENNTGWRLSEAHGAAIDALMQEKYPGSFRERASLKAEWTYYAKKYGKQSKY